VEKEQGNHRKRGVGANWGIQARKESTTGPNRRNGHLLTGQKKKEGGAGNPPFKEAMRLQREKAEKGELEKAERGIRAGRRSVVKKEGG